VSGKSPPSARRVAIALIALAAGLVAVDQIGGAGLRGLYAASPANPLLRPALQANRILVLGSSTAKRAFDPAGLWPGTYNAAEDGQGIFFVAAYLRNLPVSARYDRVVVGVDMSEMAGGHASPNSRNLKRLAPLAIGDAKLRAQLRRADPQIDLKYRSGLYPFRGEAPALLAEAVWPGAPDNGYRPLAGAMTKAPPPAEPLPPQKPAPESLDAIADMVAAAERRGFTLVLIGLPMAGGYRPDRDPGNAGILAAIRAAHSGKACDLLGAATPEIDALARDPANFRDGPHFNGPGALAYSRLARALIDARCG
jgi:nucleotide-binding universal stress UspA family protein